MPFLAYGIDGLIGNMIDFIEDLPGEWRPKWEEMKHTSNGLDEILGKFTTDKSIRNKENIFNR